jgi:hypothetical protein
VFGACFGFRASDFKFANFVGWDDDDDEWPGIGVSVFDVLSQGQKQAAILAVVRALLDPAVEPADVTAVAAGSVDRACCRHGDHRGGMSWPNAAQYGLRYSDGAGFTGAGRTMMSTAVP